MRNVAVMGFDADDGKTILVVVSVDPTLLYAPDPSAPHVYANKNGQHIGEVVGASFHPIKDAVVTENEMHLIVRASFALRNALANVCEVDAGMSHQLTQALMSK